jgi:hypothetical protein
MNVAGFSEQAFGYNITQGKEGIKYQPPHFVEHYLKTSTPNSSLLLAFR